jgi:hypothetical protein
MKGRSCRLSEHKILIWDSAPWKQGLVRYTQLIDKWRRQTRLTERTCYLIERETFVAFYSIRKLIEAQKISRRVLDDPVTVIAHSVKAKTSPDLLSSHRVDKFYDLRSTAEKAVSLDRVFLCNQFIHSFILALIISDDGSFSGFFVNSDRTKSKVVYRVDAGVVHKIAFEIGTDDPSYAQWSRGADGEVRRTI